MGMSTKQYNRKGEQCHPARFSDPIIDELRKLSVGITGTVLDPFAGTGKVHQLERRGLKTVGVEIEPEWAEMHPNTVVGNALRLPFADRSFDAVITSPSYGNRMADSHDAKDGSRRHTYTHVLGRKLHNDNSGAMQWGPEYKHFHLKAWMEAWRVLKNRSSKTRMIVNISNHIRNGEEVDVTEWHMFALEAVGFRQLDVRTIATQRNRDGANGDLRCESESILVYGCR